ncbi:hypothetical protein G6F22_021778 [Rhizopus arrhizus]|nr:hypothetical protein G6F22_021778 [Rhizopus arrhizus]
MPSNALPIGPPGCAAAAAAGSLRRMVRWNQATKPLRALLERASACGLSHTVSSLMRSSSTRSGELLASPSLLMRATASSKVLNSATLRPCRNRVHSRA